MYRIAYSLVVVRVECSVDEVLQPPPDIVDLTGFSESGQAPDEWFLARFDRPEDVPLPPQGRPWPIPRIGSEPPTRQVQLFYRVGKVREVPRLFDLMPAGTKCRFRLGGKGWRLFAECLVEQADETLRDLTRELVRNASSHSSAPLGWEAVALGLVWAELPSGVCLSWSFYGDDDEDSGLLPAPAVLANLQEFYHEPSILFADDRRRSPQMREALSVYEAAEAEVKRYTASPEE